MMRRHRLMPLLIPAVLLIPLVPVAAPAAAAQQEVAVTADPPSTEGRVYAIRNPGGVLDIQPYRSGSYEQVVERMGDGELRITTRVPDRLPSPRDAFPLTATGQGTAPYLRPTRYIQSGDPAIVAVGREIVAQAQPRTQLEAVAAVLTWNRRHMQWALPDEVPDAVTALQRGTGNCIGFVHLPAAILRSLGIPARTVRTFAARPATGHLVPHYLLEVHFASEDVWITYEPQLPGVPLLNNIVLYTDADWSVEGQRATRPFSRDPATRVLGGIPASGLLDFDPPEVRRITVRPSGSDVTIDNIRVEVTVDAHDAGSGLYLLSAGLSYAEDGVNFFSMRGGGCGSSGPDRLTGAWGCTILFNAGSPAGKYKLFELRVTDAAGNATELLGDLDLEPLTDGITFTLVNTDPGLTKPIVTDIRFNDALTPGGGPAITRITVVTAPNPRHPRGDPAESIGLSLSHDESGAWNDRLRPTCNHCLHTRQERRNGVWVTVRAPGCDAIAEPRGTFVCDIALQPDIRPGTWSIDQLRITNTADLFENLLGSELRAAGLPVDMQVQPPDR